MIANKPAELFRPSTRFDDQLLYGRLLFRSPQILGGKAVRIGLSCNSCHTNGHVNSGFYIQGLSDRPGRVDVTHRFWQAGFDDGVDNPIDIPSLRGVSNTAPYGAVNIFPDLPAFTRHVISDEFAGPPPSQEQVEGLIAYMNALDFSNLQGERKPVQTRKDMTYLPLLEAPLANRDTKKIDELVDLIRADYGQRVSRKSEATTIQIVRILKELQKKAAANDFAAALHLYRELVPVQ
ncbi:MAG: hypothetical protein K9G33_07230 [Sneathiella sp.]|nr:hypothetical protein [Sneathiella sp.]